MRRGAVEVIVELFDVLAMVAFGIGQPEQPLLEDRIAAVPQRKTEAEQQLVIAKAADPVFAPAIGPAARMVMREIIPGGAVLAVILTHRSPLAFAEIWPPAPPMPPVVYFLQAHGFRSQDSCLAQVCLC